ncbi:lipopolysaccharide heptosyltransferase family protein [Hymenobacter oligotrophus]|uniref:Lipopolysaccharide heptosyltransferase family protein n=1 Tax=Hymenobacter oligotrophus TaxID=2319843 RepID=A0A3B7RGU1_9BACT|nr:glycosyltransferase family 9 protein [Hymenobacter oligotrophus]AYA38416.1 lipopolysaccharide heptosyltransferase family protein [Hymenobacter oligotrophus]
MKTFIISRTDAIGDVVLTLPLCGWLKQQYPGCRVVLLGRSYTQAVAAACPAVDDFLNDDELRQLPETEQVAALRRVQADAIVHIFPSRRLATLARKAGISQRIGTRSRWFHWLTCNRLVALSRRHSPLHEAQLNCQLLRPLGLKHLPTLADLQPLGRIAPTEPVPAEVVVLLERGSARQLNIVLHPGSRGSGRDWPLEHYGQLARLLHAQGHRVLVTGTATEGEQLKPWLQEHAAVCHNLTGRLSLGQFIGFIALVDGLVAASTGPVHLAAALGRHALGLFVPMHPMHPGRWAPLGPKAEYLVLNKPDCNDCRQDASQCRCIRGIVPAEVAARIGAWQPLAAQ